jgi:uncharacterized protein (DUF697 family)
MSALGIGPRDVISLARHARDVAPRGPLLVMGVLAEQLAREFAAGGDPQLVQTRGNPADAAALVCVLAGAATAADEEALRAATRALVPVVCVQTGPTPVRVPYVLATDVVECAPGKGFPVADIADTLAAALGHNGAALAGSLPVLRDAVERRRAVDGALAAGALAFASDPAPRLPALALAQSRMLSELGAAAGRPAPQEARATAEAIAPPLVAALATGLVARTVVRRLPVRNRLLDGIVAAAATYGLAAAFRLARRG